MRKLGFAITMLVAFALGPAALAQSAEGLTKALHIYDNYRVVPNITYLTANNWDAKLDVYQARDAKGLIDAHLFPRWGMGPRKQGGSFADIPSLPRDGLERGERRVSAGKVSLAPAAVQDALCALRWVYRNGKGYNVDTGRLVLMGNWLADTLR